MQEMFMKAVLSPKSGSPDVLQYKEINKPRPKSDEILIKVHYASVTSGDIKVRKFNRAFLTIVGLVAGFKPMKIPGVEYAGTIEEVGSQVTSFSRGEAICGTTTGLSYGANAEYVCVPQKPKMGVIAKKPEKISFRDAACTPVGSMTAMWFLKKAQLKKGDHILIYGASGSVGSFAVQLAKHFGAKVTAVCSAANVEMMKSLGADQVIDYKKENFAEKDQKYDIIFDAVGKTTKSKSAPTLADNGKFVTVKTLTSEKVEDLEYVLKLVESGKVKTVIDKEYPLEQIVKAHRYVESGRKKGNVAIRVAG
jgi:NADPH:quinone reductase-like Zn-dependent oxidoreductase